MMRVLRQIALSAFVCAVLAPAALAQTPSPAPAPAQTPAAAPAPTPSPPGAAVYIINPKDGDVITSPFKVVFGLTGMGVAPAGDGVCAGAADGAGAGAGAGDGVCAWAEAASTAQTKPDNAI